MWFSHYSQLNLLKGASSGGATLTDTDLANIRDVVWEKQIESGYEAQELMRLFASVLGGLLSQVGNQTPEFYSLDHTKIRVKYATDGTGNRTKRLEIDLT